MDPKTRIASLTIKKATLEDSGQYSCVAYGDLGGHATTTADIQILREYIHKGNMRTHNDCNNMNPDCTKHYIYIHFQYHLYILLQKKTSIICHLVQHMHYSQQSVFLCVNCVWLLLMTSFNFPKMFKHTGTNIERVLNDTMLSNLFCNRKVI